MLLIYASSSASSHVNVQSVSTSSVNLENNTPNNTFLTNCDGDSVLSAVMDLRSVDRGKKGHTPSKIHTPQQILFLHR